MTFSITIRVSSDTPISARDASDGWYGSRDNSKDDMGHGRVNSKNDMGRGVIARMIWVEG